MNYLPKILTFHLSFTFFSLKHMHFTGKRCDKADKKDKQSFSGCGNKVQWKAEQTWIERSWWIIRVAARFKHISSLCSGRVESHDPTTPFSHSLKPSAFEVYLFRLCYYAYPMFYNIDNTFYVAFQFNFLLKILLNFSMSINLEPS